MSKTPEYLEKYTVAPSPSRDYYGLKLLKDEVKLFHWPICQRPYKPPVTRSISFAKWEADRDLQVEIEQVFGSSWFDYINDIVSNRKSLLTLPRDIFGRLLNFLAVNDVLKLFQLSRTSYEILNDERVWEVLFRKIKGADFHKAQKRYGTAYGWKQLLKDTEDIEMYTERRRSLQSKRPLSQTKASQPSSSESLIKPKLEVTRSTSSRRSAAVPIAVNTLKLEFEAPGDKSKPKKPTKEPKPSEASSEKRLAGNQRSMNFVNLNVKQLTSKSKASEPERHSSFRAKPAPKSTFQSSKIKQTSSALKLSSYRQKFSPSLSSLRHDETSLDSLIRKTYNDLNQEKKQVMNKNFEWLKSDTSPRGAVGDVEILTPLTMERQSLKDEYELDELNDKLNITNEYKMAKESLLETFDSNYRAVPSSEESYKSRSLKPSSVSHEMATQSGLKPDSFDWLNSKYLESQLGLKSKYLSEFNSLKSKFTKVTGKT